MTYAYGVDMANTYMVPPARYTHGQTQLAFAQYQDGSPALLLLDPNTGELVAKATVYIPDARLSPNHITLKGWSENEGIPEALQNAGVVRLTGETITTGHAEAQVAELLVQAF